MKVMKETKTDLQGVLATSSLAPKSINDAIESQVFSFDVLTRGMLS